jgi:protein-S-isoprenylcysteine O-methyltransferase
MGGNLETIPTSTAHTPHGDIPNTPLMASIIAFSLGIVFAIGFPARLLIGAQTPFWWYTYPLTFFGSSWAAFHYLEFAITAGWNREKCSVDCEWALAALSDPSNLLHSAFLLNNGRMYHAANSFAVIEYLLSLHFKPSWKLHTYITCAGLVLWFFLVS